MTNNNNWLVFINYYSSNIFKILLIIFFTAKFIVTDSLAKNIITNSPLSPVSAETRAIQVTPAKIPDVEIVPAIAPYNSLANIVEPLIPAVVNIYTLQYSKKLVDPRKPSDHFPFDHFNELLERFNLPFNLEEIYSDPKSFPLGSGFIIDPSGFIVTNHHVIANADEIHIKLTDNREFPAKLVASDKKTDLALLKIDSDSLLPFVKFGDSAKSRVGDWVIAIGNPFGRLGGTVTAGIISSKGRDIDSTNGVVDDFIQTDAAINNGSSGGPMFNIAGEVIGVNTAIFSPSRTNIGIGFAIPSNTASSIIEQLRKNGKINRGRLGVIIQEVTNEISEGLDLKEASGALVVEVQKDGPGDKMGLKAGDVIIEFAGQPVKNSRKLQVLVAETAVDQEVKIIVVRKSEELMLKGKVSDEELETKIKDNVTNKPIDDKAVVIKNNITFSNLTNDLKKKFAIKDDATGVIVTNIAKDQQNYGFRIGDLIVATSQQPINSLEQLNLLYQNAKIAKKQNIILFVQRQGISVFIPLPVTY